MSKFFLSTTGFLHKLKDNKSTFLTSVHGLYLKVSSKGRDKPQNLKLRKPFNYLTHSEKIDELPLCDFYAQNTYFAPVLLSNGDRSINPCSVVHLHGPSYVRQCNENTLGATTTRNRKPLNILEGAMLVYSLKSLIANAFKLSIYFICYLSVCQ